MSLSFTIHDTEQGNFPAKFEMLDSVLNITFNTVWGLSKGCTSLGRFDHWLAVILGSLKTSFSESRKFLVPINQLKSATLHQL